MAGEAAGFALERGLQAELTGHLGYEKGAPEASLFDNSRNGSMSKTVSTSVGDIELSTPRDRDGSFIPRLVPKGSRRLGGLDDMIVSLYAGGMTIADIEHHLATTLGTELSRETISKITDEVLKEVLAWQRRPLEALYPVIYLDALVVKVRDGGHVINKAAHIAVGVDMDGIKPAQTSQREGPQRSPALSETTSIRRCLPPTHARRRPPRGGGPGRTLGGDYEIQRDRCNPNHRLFGPVTSRTHQRQRQRAEHALPVTQRRAV